MSQIELQKMLYEEKLHSIDEKVPRKSGVFQVFHLVPGTLAEISYCEDMFISLEKVKF